MIKASRLSKKFKKKFAVNDLSFEVETGKVTGFLGPNGAGKSTTMRLMLGLDNGGGRTTYDGKILHSYKQPAKVAGILLEAKAFHPTRSVKNHLEVLATAGNIPSNRVDEVLDIVGLSDVKKGKPGKFSLGMSQRLGIAAAILGEPKYLILDEPANGLDPEGIAWLRQFLRDYAEKGRGVLVSSHLLSEMSQMADNVIVIGKGKLIADTSIEKLLARSSSEVFVRADSLSTLKKALKDHGIKYAESGKGLTITSVKTDDIGKLAFKASVTLLELTPHTASLEQAFLELTEGSEEFSGKEQSGKKP
ncbi:MAG TPA: ATP-binding cassette domain-containing protein [Candidatus Saccharimonadales bacterium]|nr:ATP-binding cassette domain-containing protein [Candidatus Saccharimonadales bacterium]